MPFANGKLAAGSVAKFILMALIIVGLYFGGRRVGLFSMTLEELSAQMRAYPSFHGLALYVAAYAFISVAPIPGRDIFKLVAAAVWGWWLSTLAVLAGEMLAAFATFYMGRLLGKELLDRLFGHKLEKAYAKLNEAGFRNVMILRLIPLTPYRFLNYAAGVTDLRPAPYFAGSLVGAFGRTLFFQSVFAVIVAFLASWGIEIGHIVIGSMLFAALMLTIWYLRNQTKRSSAH